ncbi:MAG: hypothetical protein M3Q81_00385 [bacterium]|nr:hypothetical protein [bacterium]
MGPDNFIDTRNFRHVTQDMVAALTPRSRFLSRVSEPTIGKGFMVLDVGSYTVVLAGDARELSQALRYVPQEKRPAINHELFEFYAETFPGRSVALCCFNQSLEAVEPLMFWWEPRDLTRFIMPALDAHTGRAPVFGQTVEVNHWLIASSYRMRGGEEVSYRDYDAIPGPVQLLLPERVTGCLVKGFRPNGDFTVSTEKVYRVPPHSHLQDRDFSRLTAAE